MMKTLADDLRAAKALIDTPEKWAHSNRERFAHWFGDAPEKLDALDACERVTVDWSLVEILRSVTPEPFGSVTPFNHDPATTHADIMALFQRAIEAAEAADAPR